MAKATLRSEVGVFALALAILAGCSSTDAGVGQRGLGKLATPSPSSTAPIPGPLAGGSGLQPYGDAVWPAYAVSPRTSRLAVRSRPGGPVVRTLSNRLPLGAPLTLLLVGRQTGWLQVELPVRPNGSTGWVREADTRLRGLQYGLAVQRSRHRLVLYDRYRRTRTFVVGIGTRETPTPGWPVLPDRAAAPVGPGRRLRAVRVRALRVFQRDPPFQWW